MKIVSSDKAQQVIDALYNRVPIEEAFRSLGITAQNFFNYVSQVPDFQEKYMRARQIQAELLVDEMTVISDTEPDVNRARVRIDTRKWVASKHSPKIYGERLDVTLNHIVDIGSALSEAKQRVVVNVPDQIPLTKDVDIIGLIAQRATDCESVDDTIDSNADNDNDPIDLSSLDIFK